MSEPHQHQAQQPDEQQANDKVALRASQAGMRFIAQTHIYNGGDSDRLTQFIKDSYSADMLEEQPVDGRLSMFKTTREKIGRLKVKQVVATAEHRVVVVVETETGEFPYFLVDLIVEEEYPHKIIGYSHQPLKPSESQADA